MLLTLIGCLRRLRLLCAESEALRMTKKFAKIGTGNFDKWSLKKNLIINILEWRNIFAEFPVM